MNTQSKISSARRKVFSARENFLRRLKEIVYFLADTSNVYWSIRSYGNLKKFLKKFVLKEYFQTLLSMESMPVHSRMI